MKTYFLIFVVLFLGCGNSPQSATQPVASVNNNSVLQNTDTIKTHNPEETKRHFALVSQVFSMLHLDSLNSNDGEAYRIIILKASSLGDMGNPISITFYKKGDKKSVVTKEIFADKGNAVVEKTHTISSSASDSISNMFNNYFWAHDITDYNCTEMIINGSSRFYEAFKDGKHKLISQSNCPDKELLPNAYFNFFIFSEYNKAMTEDFIWFKNNPPGNIKTPGPPSTLKK